MTFSVNRHAVLGPFVMCCVVMLFSAVQCGPHDRRAIDKSFGVVLSSNQSQRNDTGAILPAGEAFNIFQSYGLLAFNINVAPLILLPTSSRANNNGSFQPYPLFQMITHPVLDRRLFTAEIKRQPINRVQQQGMERSVRLHLCPTTESLTTRLLQGFTVDGLQKPWWAFTASWKKHILPRVYGVPANYLTDDYVFLLVRIEKRSIVGTVNGTLLLEPDLLAKLPLTQADPNPGSKSWRSAVDFFYQFGTHIISDYSTGDALFQVIVYNSSSLPVLAEKMIELRTQVDRINPTNATRIEWVKLLHGQSSPVHVGKLQLISGNRSLVNWLEPRLALSSLPDTLPSSIRLLGAPVLFNIFYRQLQPRAVLSMNLVSITKAMPETPRRQWLNDVLFNLLRMWEYNM